MTPPHADDPWVTVAVFQRPHGLRGEVRLRPLTRTPEELLDCGRTAFRARRGGVWLGELTLGGWKVQRGLVYAFFDEIPDRTAAERFTNADLVVPETEMWQPPDGGYYIYQLEGLAAVDAGTGEVLGRVKTGREGAAHDFLVLDLDAARGREVLLPIVPAFVHSIDIAAGKATVSLPEGLVEETT